MTCTSSLFKRYQYGKVLGDVLLSLEACFFHVKLKNAVVWVYLFASTSLIPITAINFPGNNFCKYSINGLRSNYSLN
jgi:hypothetical protein